MEDSSSLEKQVENDVPAQRYSGATAAERTGDEHSDHGAKKLYLSEEEAMRRARGYPGDKLPVYLTYSVNDKENPRSWSLGRKWFITCFVSLLNVLTYGGCPFSLATYYSYHTDAYVLEAILPGQMVSLLPLTCLPRLRPWDFRCISWASLLGRCF